MILLCDAIGGWILLSDAMGANDTIVGCNGC